MKLRRKLGKLMLVFGAVALPVLLLPPEPVSAHTDADEYVPATDALLPIAPSVISIRFSGTLDASTLQITLRHRDGQMVPFTGEGLTFQGNTVSATPPALDYGTYVIVWKSIGADGHLAVGQSHFSVGRRDMGTVTNLTAGTGFGDMLLSTFSRVALYTVLAMLLGFWWLKKSGLKHNMARRQRLTKIAAFVGGGVLMLRLLAVSIRIGNENGIGKGLGIVITTWPTNLGWMIVIVGASVSMLAARAKRASVIGVGLVVVGETLLGHLGTAKGYGVLVPLGALHLLGAIFWIGGIVGFVACSEMGKDNWRKFLRTFSPYAASSVVLLGVSGVALGILRTRVDTLAKLTNLLDYRYGQTLTLKLLILLLGVAPFALYHAAAGLIPRLKTVYAKLIPDDDVRPETTSSTTHNHSTPDTTPDAKISANMFNSLRGELAWLLVVLLLGASLAGLKPTADIAVANKVDLLAVPQTFRECIDGNTAADPLLCVTSYFEGVVADKDMKAALTEISATWAEGDPWMKSYCHVLGHKLGKLGFKIYKTVAKAFEAGSDPCDYGYLHGVIQGASADFTDQELYGAMTTMCAEVGDIRNHGYRQCIHGLGHAAELRVNYDLARGMEYCRAYGIPTANKPESEMTAAGVEFRLCVTGVAMEWISQSKINKLGANLPVGAPGTPLRECLKLAAEFQPGCLEYGTSSLGGVLSRELEARDWCDANLDEPLACYQSIGRDVIWSPTITPAQAMAVCTGGRGGIYAEQCIMRALGSVATIALDAKAIDLWCVHVPAQYQYTCPIVRDAMVVQLKDTLQGFIVAPSSDSNG